MALPEKKNRHIHPEQSLEEPFVHIECWGLLCTFQPYKYPDNCPAVRNKTFPLDCSRRHNLAQKPAQQKLKRKIRTAKPIAEDSFLNRSKKRTFTI
jgi:hypothetical protein